MISFNKPYEESSLNRADREIRYHWEFLSGDYVYDETDENGKTEEPQKENNQKISNIPIINNNSKLNERIIFDKNDISNVKKNIFCMNKINNQKYHSRYTKHKIDREWYHKKIIKNNNSFKNRNISKKRTNYYHRCVHFRCQKN